MISSPAPNQPVQVHYRKEVAPHMPLHGLTGRVLIRSKGRPRNHAVLLVGQFVVVPAGNLRAPK